MPQEEYRGTRDRSYSAWHRRRSSRRFVGIERAQTLAMIDLDASLYVEYDDFSREPLALIETAIDIGQDYKNAQVTTRLAERAHIPAYVVLYRLASTPNPADPEWPDIDRFRVKRLYPKRQSDWTIYTPQEWAHRLVHLREWSACKLDKQFNGIGTRHVP